MQKQAEVSENMKQAGREPRFKGISKFQSGLLAGRSRDARTVTPLNVSEV